MYVLLVLAYDVDNGTVSLIRISSEVTKATRISTSLSSYSSASSGDVSGGGSLFAGAGFT